MITSLSMENWRSHRSTSLQFRKGTNLLIGIMGSGKSSVLDAMCFALFGKFPSLEHKTLSTEDIITHGETRAAVKLGMDWDGSAYEITRELRKGPGKRASSEAWIRKDGKLAEQGQSAVNKYVEHVLKADYELFSRAIYSEQNGIDRFLTLEAGKRKQEIDELLGLDKFETARANAVKIVNSRKSLAAKLAEQFDRKKLEDAKRRELEAKEKMLALENSMNSFSSSLEQNRKAAKAAEGIFLALREKKARHEKLSVLVSESRGAIAQLAREASGMKHDEGALAAAKARLAVLEATSISLKKEAVELQSAHSSLSKELGSLEGRMELGRSAAAELASATSELKLLLAGKKPAEAENACKAAERELIEISSRAQSISSELRRLEEGVKKLEPGMSKCPVCRSPITPEGMKHVLGECTGEIASVKEELKRVSSEKESRSREKSGLDAALRRIQNLSERVRMLEKQVSESGSLGEKAAVARASLSSLGAQLEAKRKSVDSASAELQKAREARSRLEDALANAKKLAELQSSLAGHEAELKSLGFGETEFESARTSFESARNEGEKLALSLASARSEHRSCAELLKSASSEAKDLESIARQVSKLERECEEMSIYRNALVETQAELRTEVVAALNSAMNEIWAIIYPYADYKGLRMIANESGYKFEISDGSWRPAELASGGERATIALSLRIALATVLTPNISMLILDEPTHNLDKEAVGVLARVLQYNLPELIGQAFVITHDEELMGSEFASTYRMRRDKKENGPTACEEI